MDYNDIICELNEYLSEDIENMGISFSYETNGYWE